MKKVLLTGANGFIGSHVLRFLSSCGIETITPLRKENCPPEKEPAVSGQRIIYGNFYDREVLNECAGQNPEAIVHIAGIRGEGNGAWDDYYRVNVEGTERLVDFARANAVKRFVYLSSVGVYGSIPKELPALVRSEAAPDNNYHRSKFEAEIVIRTKLSDNIPFVILRPSITYGEGDNGFLPKLIYLVKRRIFPLVYPDIKIHLLNVQTVAEAVLGALEMQYKKDIVVNLADKESVSLRALVNYIYQLLYGKNYPAFLKMPGFGLRAGEWSAHALKFAKHETSIKLISRSWYYDIDGVEQALGIRLKETLSSIGRLLAQNGSAG